MPVGTGALRGLQEGPLICHPAHLLATLRLRGGSQTATFRDSVKSFSFFLEQIRILLLSKQKAVDFLPLLTNRRQPPSNIFFSIYMHLKHFFLSFAFISLFRFSFSFIFSLSFIHSFLHTLSLLK